MKKILLFGAGKSATVLIDYLINEAANENWQVIIADANLDLITLKTGHHPATQAVELDIQDAEKRKMLIAQSDLVISMMPPALHILIAHDCLQLNRSLLTASYVDEAIQALHEEAKQKGLLFLCEMGLDPGIDHMSAMKIIDHIKVNGGNISSFKSHCGGLVAPESDDNPWHYKISWNPRNVVLAGKAGAIFLENGSTVQLEYAQLFSNNPVVDISQDEHFSLSYYPNRNSLPYIDLYNLQGIRTFVRTTLRYPNFMKGWHHLIELKLTDETPAYETDGLSLSDFFKIHLKRHQLTQWVDDKISSDLSETRNQLAGLEKQLEHNPASLDPATLQQASSLIQFKVNEAQQLVERLIYLGLQDHETLINKGFCSAADVLQFILEKKLVLQPSDKDMIVMLHEFEYLLNGEKHTLNSSLVVKGKDHLHTAMAKTVGLPLGIAAKKMLNGEITATGVKIPTTKDIYDPVLAALENFGIKFQETLR